MFLSALPGSLSPPSPRCRVGLGSRTFSDSRICCSSGRSERRWAGRCCAATLTWCLICSWTPDWARWRRAGAARCCGSRKGSESNVQAPTLTSDSRHRLLCFSEKHRTERFTQYRTTPMRYWTFIRGPNTEEFFIILYKNKNYRLQVRETRYCSALKHRVSHVVFPITPEPLPYSNQQNFKSR